MQELRVEPDSLKTERRGCGTTTNCCCNLAFNISSPSEIHVTGNYLPGTPAQEKHPRHLQGSEGSILLVGMAASILGS